MAVYNDMVWIGISIIIISLVLIAAAYPRFSVTNLFPGIFFAVLGLIITILGVGLGGLEDLMDNLIYLDMGITLTLPILVVVLIAPSTQGVYNKYVIGISMIVLLFVVGFFI